MLDANIKVLPDIDSIPRVPNLHIRIPNHDVLLRFPGSTTVNLDVVGMDRSPTVELMQGLVV